jgi:hypothetical protein
MKVGVITFLLPGLGLCLLTTWSCRWKQASGWGQFWHHCSAKRMKEAFDVTCKTTRIRVDGNQVKECAWSEYGTDQSSYVGMNWLEMNMVIIVSKKVWHRGRLIMVRLQLVVATRLHTQLSSFWLRILSKTPSCSEESHKWNTFANPIRHTLSIL